MNDPLSFASLHDAVTWLLTPALVALLLACAIALIEAGIAVSERFSGLAQLKASGDLLRVQTIARHRLERADLLARIPPMLGLMATIIPLGPGDDPRPGAAQPGCDVDRRRRCRHVRAGRRR